jgi:hypothetical protein
LLIWVDGRFAKSPSHIKASDPMEPQALDVRRESSGTSSGTEGLRREVRYASGAVELINSRWTVNACGPILVVS